MSGGNLFFSVGAYIYVIHKHKHKRMNTLVFPFAYAFWTTGVKIVLLHSDNQAQVYQPEEMLG